jgi:hypothetical protein
MDYLSMVPGTLWIKDSAAQPKVILSTTVKAGLQCVLPDQTQCLSNTPSNYQDGEEDLSTITQSRVLDEHNKEDNSIGVMTIGIMSPQRLDDEAALSVYLSKLYTNPFEFQMRKVQVGGQILNLMSFHYPAYNDEAPKNKTKREYIDSDEKAKLFSYELKGALCTTAVQVEVNFRILYRFN